MNWAWLGPEDLGPAFWGPMCKCSHYRLHHHRGSACHLKGCQCLVFDPKEQIR
jgi:hypothetical protein